MGRFYDDIVSGAWKLVWLSPLKGIVQRDLTGVETRLKWSALINYSVAKFAFWIFKEHHHNRSTKPVSASWQQLNWTYWLSPQNPANDSLRTMGAMTTRPRFMRPRSIGPRSISPIGWWVPYTMSPFVMIGPIFVLWFFEGTNWTCLILAVGDIIFFLNYNEQDY